MSDRQLADLRGVARRPHLELGRSGPLLGESRRGKGVEAVAIEAVCCLPVLAYQPADHR